MKDGSVQESSQASTLATPPNEVQDAHTEGASDQFAPQGFVGKIVTKAPGLQDAALINEIKKALQDLQDEMKKKDQEIEELRKKILVAEDYRKDMEAGIINIKGIDFNDMEPKDFEEWFQLEARKVPGECDRKTRSLLSCVDVSPRV